VGVGVLVGACRTEPQDARSKGSRKISVSFFIFLSD
jgi:hypothetical protein